MDSVIMTTPGNSMRLRSRFRSAANTICARSSKTRSTSNKNHNSSGKSVRGFYKSHGGSRESKNCAANKHVNMINNRNTLLLDDSNNRCVVATSNNNGNERKDNKLSAFCRGKCAREVYNAWCGRLGDVTRIPSDSVQALFNDMQLYPSKSQVLEMLACARTCGRRNTSHFLTFGEFCVFASELRRGGRGRPHHNQVQRTAKPISSHCEVFLGGSCNPTTWRADVAIPALSKLGISYYNPQVSTWGPELMAAEHSAKESASVLLFVVDSQTRCVAGMLEVAHLVAKQRCLVLVVYPFSRGQSIMDEPLSAQEYKDLTEGQSTLLTLVRNQGITVHSNLSAALQCTVSILRGTENTTDNTTERRLTEKLMTLRETFDALDPDRTGELTLSNVSEAYFQLTSTNLRISDLHSIMNLSDHTSPDDVRITFEQFCGVMAEFTTTGGCNTTTTTRLDDWVNQPLRQTSTNNNSNFEYTSLNNHKQNGEHYVVNSDSSQRYDVYLGGSCMKKTTWRQNIAIPLLKKYGVTYYNPSLHEANCAQQDNRNAQYGNGDHCDPDMNDNSSVECAKRSAKCLLHDMDVMNNSTVVLFVITNETRSITSMILAAHYIALRKNVVLCVQQLPLEHCIIGSDVLTKQATKDYNRARAYLSDLAKHENVPIFPSVKEAVQCVVNLAQTQQR